MMYRDLYYALQCTRRAAYKVRMYFPPQEWKDEYNPSKTNYITHVIEEAICEGVTSLNPEKAKGVVNQAQAILGNTNKHLPNLPDRKSIELYAVEQATIVLNNSVKKFSHPLHRIDFFRELFEPNNFLHSLTNIKTMQRDEGDNNGIYFLVVGVTDEAISGLLLALSMLEFKENQQDNYSIRGIYRFGKDDPEFIPFVRSVDLEEMAKDAMDDLQQGVHDINDNNIDAVYCSPNKTNCYRCEVLESEHGCTEHSRLIGFEKIRIVKGVDG